MALAIPRWPLGRFTLVAVVLLVSFSFVHYLDVIPGSMPFTTPRPDTPKPDMPNPKTADQGQAHDGHGGQGVQEQGQSPGRKPEKPGPDYNKSAPCIPELDYLKREELGLTSTVRFSRRCITPAFSLPGPEEGSEYSADRDLVASVAAPLLTYAPLDIDLLSCSHVSPSHIPCDPLALPNVPRPYPERAGQYGHLLFAVATSFDRLNGSRAHFAHWMAGSGSPLVALITDRPDTEAGQTWEDVQAVQRVTWPALAADYANAGISLEMVQPHGPEHTVPQSHMLVLLDMLDHVRVRRTVAAPPASPGVADTGLRHDEVQWLGILDDDTFLPALEPLSAALAAHDHTVPAYLGELSESFEATRFGMAAFGGAGIFISVPLAEELEPYLSGCLSGRGGDMQLMECIHDHTHARLVRIKGLQQQDMNGDLAGFFESGWRFITLHHWKTWYHAPVLEMARVAHMCGSCFLKRWRFGAGSSRDAPGEEGPGRGEDETAGARGPEREMVLTNGFSIAEYANGLPDLSLMEGTWDRAETKDYRWSLGPIRPKMRKEDKKVWKLVESVPDDQTGQLTQIYVHKDEAEEDPADEVIELVWSGNS